MECFCQEIWGVITFNSTVANPTPESSYQFLAAISGVALNFISHTYINNFVIYSHVHNNNETLTKKFPKHHNFGVLNK